MNTPKTDFTPTESRELNGGSQHFYEFANGWQASVIQHSGSYGYDAGLWELAVMDDERNLSYETAITDDVLGYLTDDEVGLTLEAIGELPANGGSV